eukprot:g4873.t1
MEGKNERAEEALLGEIVDGLCKRIRKRVEGKVWGNGLKGGEEVDDSVVKALRRFKRKSEDTDLEEYLERRYTWFCDSMMLQNVSKCYMQFNTEASELSVLEDLKPVETSYLDIRKSQRDEWRNMSVKLLTQGIAALKEGMYRKAASLFRDAYSNSLHDEMFQNWRSEFGYDIHVKRYDIEAMLRESVASKPEYGDLLLHFFETLRAQPIRYPNVEADLIRLLALLSHGGVYLDLDAIVLRPLHGLTNVAAWEGDVPDSLLSASQCAQETGTKCTIGNAVLIFDSGNTFLESCLIRWLRKYTDTGGRLNWEYAGEVLTDTFWENEFEESTLRVLSRKSFYFYGQFGWGRFFNRQPDERRQYSRLLRESHVAHFWNHVHTHHLPERGSLMFHVLNDFRLQLGDPQSGVREKGGGDLVEFSRL